MVSLVCWKEVSCRFSRVWASRRFSSSSRSARAWALLVNCSDRLLSPEPDKQYRTLYTKHKQTISGATSGICYNPVKCQERQVQNYQAFESAIRRDKSVVREIKHAVKWQNLQSLAELELQIFNYSKVCWGLKKLILQHQNIQSWKLSNNHVVVTADWPTS